MHGARSRSRNLTRKRKIFFHDTGTSRATAGSVRGKSMDLQTRLDAKKQEFESSAPEGVLAVVHRAAEDLRNSGILERALGVGAKAPDFKLNNAEGEPVRLLSMLSQGPVVLGFYRGRW